MLRTVTAPLKNHEEVYDYCVSQYAKNEIKQNFNLLRPAVIGQGYLFVALAQKGGVLALEPIDVSKNDQDKLEDMYELRLVNKNGISRETYDAIRSVSSVCPYCGFGEVSELDHFLAKSVFPELSVCPLNLIPVCHRCNHLKGATNPTPEGNFFFNPYFDSVPHEERWLFARIEIVNGGPKLTYWIDTSAFGDTLAHRLEFHFEKLELCRRYQERAAEILVEMQQHVEMYLSKLGEEGIRLHFVDEAIRWGKKTVNGLEATAYLAASLHDDFCNGNFKN